MAVIYVKEQGALIQKKKRAHIDYTEQTDFAGNSI